MQVSKTLDTCRAKCRKSRHYLEELQSHIAKLLFLNQLPRSRFERVFGKCSAPFRGVNGRPNPKTLCKTGIEQRTHDGGFRGDRHKIRSEDFPSSAPGIPSRENIVIAWLLIAVLVILGFLCISDSFGDIDRKLHRQLEAEFAIGALQVHGEVWC
jgi:hypothetical protein